MKSIRLSKHARGNMQSRGTTEAEVFETIKTAKWGTAERGRLECRKDFTFQQSWNGKLYKMKQVRPIFVEEAEEIIVVTVYVYFF